ncbi:Ubiquinol-cytochrome-c reductase complex assembly factor 1 [Linum grandiflorum]
MLQRWSKAVSHLSKVRSATSMQPLPRKDYSIFVPRHCHSTAAATVSPAPNDSPNNSSPVKSLVNLDKMFWSKPCSLALLPGSPLRVEEPSYEGLRRVIFKMLLFYSKQSKSIRGANVAYRRIIHQVDKPAIYEVFNLEKTFKMTFSLLVLHMWFILRRLKQEGKEGSEFGQYLYEIYNHDVELRVSKAGVNLLLTKWMKELEKIFYGNIVAYDAAILPEAKPDELPRVIWRNVFADDGTSEPDQAASHAVQAMARYVRREVSCFSLTDKEAMYSGNFTFTSLDNIPSSVSAKK